MSVATEPSKEVVLLHEDSHPYLDALTAEGRAILEELGALTIRMRAWGPRTGELLEAYGIDGIYEARSDIPTKAYELFRLWHAIPHDPEELRELSADPYRVGGKNG